MAGLTLPDRLRLFRLAGVQLYRNLLLAIQSGPFYRWRYSGSPPRRLLLAPPDIRTTDPTIASDIYAGVFSLAGQVAESEGQSPFQMTAPSKNWYRALHGFGWLRHLRAEDTALSRQNALALTDEWITLCGSYDRDAWSTDILGRRIISWLSHAPLLLNGATPAFYRRFMRTLSRQVRYLNRNAPDGANGPVRLTAAIALTMAGLTMADRDRLLRRSSKWLEQELGEQILADGVHISRNPQLVCEILLDLLPLNQTFIGREMAPPPALVQAIDRMMPMVRFFRLGDGATARFNGASATRPDTLATLLAYDETRAAPLENARFSGYVRMEAGSAILVADSGATPPMAASSTAHAGALSFELSIGAHPVIVNCGTPPNADGEWGHVCRLTAAHSTATLNDMSSAHFVPPGRFRDLVGPCILSGPHRREADIADEENGRVATLRHDGYRASLGIIHRRRLALAPDGRGLKGEDLFSGEGDRELSARSEDRFAIRFHLHPTIQVALGDDGHCAILTIPGESDPWVFSADQAALSVEESVYLAATEGPRVTRQIVLSGRCALQPRVSWSLNAAANH